MDIHETALKGAKKLCGRGPCYYNLDCGHTNNEPRWPRIREDAACPLVKYNITPEENPKPWWKMHTNELHVSRDEIFALCAECENGRNCQDDNGAYVQRKNLDLCMDCPVKGAEEAMDEASAEM